MQVFIWIIWGLFPLFFLLSLTFSFLEKKFGNKRQENPKDLLSQLIFISGCVALSFLIDIYLLDVIQESIPSVPRWCFQAVLLPLVLVLAAKLFGGSKTIRVLPGSMKNKR